jgi:hypothetical protein
MLEWVKEVLMERRSAREEDEGWDKLRSMAAEGTRHTEQYNI